MRGGRRREKEKRGMEGRRMKGINSTSVAWKVRGNFNFCQGFMRAGIPLPPRNYDVIIISAATIGYTTQ